MQVSVVCFYFLDRSWEQDLPPDTTGAPHCVDCSHECTASGMIFHMSAPQVCSFFT